ncbi:unnamed protein product [Urochloa humidicola]
MCYAFDFANLLNFPTLEKVIAHINCGDATVDEVEIAEAALRLAVDNHPTTPTLEMERYCEDTMKLAVSAKRSRYAAGHLSSRILVQKAKLLTNTYPISNSSRQSMTPRHQMRNVTIPKLMPDQHKRRTQGQKT